MLFNCIHVGKNAGTLVDRGRSGERIRRTVSTPKLYNPIIRMFPFYCSEDCGEGCVLASFGAWFKVIFRFRRRNFQRTWGFGECGGSCWFLFQNREDLNSSRACLFGLQPSPWFGTFSIGVGQYMYFISHSLTPLHLHLHQYTHNTTTGPETPDWRGQHETSP